MDLTEGQMTALVDLRRKQDGEGVGFVNIADACTLVEQGYAVRARSGWEITPAGLQLLRRASSPEDIGAPPTPFRPEFVR